METITSVDGTGIAFERTGSGPPLVLVHGATADHTRWEPVRHAFEERCTVYAIDRRGRGGSGDAEEYDIEREYEDVVAVVESIDEPVVLLGHSIGALICLEAALRTANLRKLILYEPPFPVGDHSLDPPGVMDEIATLVADGENERALVRFFEEVAGLGPAEIEALRSAPNWPDRVAAAHTVLREEPVPARYEFDPARFEALTVPVLLLTGSESPAFYGDAIDALHGALPNGRPVVFEGHAHTAMNTATDEFVDAVLSFIGGE